jgi:hypothetical protein
VLCAVPVDVALVDVRVVGAIGVSSGTETAALSFVSVVGDVGVVAAVKAEAAGADIATGPLRFAPVVPFAKVVVLGLEVGTALVLVTLVLAVVALLVAAVVGAEVGAAYPPRFTGGTVTFAIGTFEIADAGVAVLTATAVPALVDEDANALEPVAAVVVPLAAPEPPEVAVGTFDVT